MSVQNTQVREISSNNKIRYNDQYHHRMVLNNTLLWLKIHHNCEPSRN